MIVKFNTEVADALKNNLPVVALESTIISHGMPYPKNLETACKVEQVVRDFGAVPATCAVVAGKLCAGLTTTEIENFSKKGQAITKVSRKDLPYIVMNKLDGATTVAATMIIAKYAGIDVFATGGIGGVHRGVAKSFDISADLLELAKTNINVVCAGAKSILDLPKTKEYLETNSVPVIGFQTNELPAFFSRNSGVPVDFAMNTVEEIAHFVKTKKQLNLTGGTLITNPIAPKDELEYSIMNEAVEKALSIAAEEQIEGKAITPFLLDKIDQITDGKSLEANIKLILNNAKLAAQLSTHLSNLKTLQVEQ